MTSHLEQVFKCWPTPTRPCTAITDTIDLRCCPDARVASGQPTIYAGPTRDLAGETFANSTCTMCGFIGPSCVRRQRPARCVAGQPTRRNTMQCNHNVNCPIWRAVYRLDCLQLKYKRSNRGTPKSLHLSPKTSNRNRKFLSFDLYCCK